jgi:hypothetical protein
MASTIGLYGTLATPRLDFDIHVCHGIRAVSTAVPVGVCLGQGLDFLATSREHGAGRAEQNKL